MPVVIDPLSEETNHVASVFNCEISKMDDQSVMCPPDKKASFRFRDGTPRHFMDVAKSQAATLCDTNLTHGITSEVKSIRRVAARRRTNSTNPRRWR